MRLPWARGFAKRLFLSFFSFIFFIIFRQLRNKVRNISKHPGRKEKYEARRYWTSRAVEPVIKKQFKLLEKKYSTVRQKATVGGEARPRVT